MIIVIILRLQQVFFNTCSKYSVLEKKWDWTKNCKNQKYFSDDSSRAKISMEDFTWLYSKYSNKNVKGYGGFMEDFHVNIRCQFSYNDV